MELSDFVQKVINDLVDAIEKSDEKNQKHDISLSATKDSRTVEFDIAVTTQEEKGKEGGGGIKVLSFVQLGGSASTQNLNSSVSRVKFGINIYDN